MAKRKVIIYGGCKKCGKPIKENTDGDDRYCQGHSILEGGGKEVRKCVWKTWFTNKVGSIGIAVFENEFGSREVRISKVDGYDEGLDILFIDEWGSSVNPADLVEIVEQFRMGKKRRL